MIIFFWLANELLTKGILVSRFIHSERGPYLFHNVIFDTLVCLLQDSSSGERSNKSFDVLKSRLNEDERSKNRLISEK